MTLLSQDVNMRFLTIGFLIAFVLSPRRHRGRRAVSPQRKLAPRQALRAVLRNATARRFKAGPARH
jgi:hypothetical protein